MKTGTNPLLNQWADGKQLGSIETSKRGLSKSNNCILCHTRPRFTSSTIQVLQVTPKACGREKPNSDCSNSPNTATKNKLQCSQFNWGLVRPSTIGDRRLEKSTMIGTVTILSNAFVLPVDRLVVV